MALDDRHPFSLTPQSLGPPQWSRTSTHDAYQYLDQHPHYMASGYSFAGHSLSVVPDQFGTAAYNFPEAFLPPNDWHPSPIIWVIDAPLIESAQGRGLFPHNNPNIMEAFPPGAQVIIPSPTA